MTRVELDLGVPNSIQKAALDLFRRGKRIVLMLAGRQSGKSHVAARWLISEIASRPEDKTKLAAVVTPTYRDARVAVRKLKEVLQSDLRLWKRIKYREQPLPTFQFPNGWLIEVHSAHDPDSLRGPTFSLVWYDEIAKGTKESFDIVTATLLASKGKLFGTTTPRGKQNWIYQHVYLRACPPGHPEHNPDLYDESYGYVSGSTWENINNLSPEAVRQLERQYGEGSLLSRQEIGGEFVSYEGLVFRWDESLNYLAQDSMPEAKDMSVVVGGLDFGWVDPTAAVVMGYKEGVWYVFDGIYESELPTNDLAEQLALLGTIYRVSVWYADSARPDTIADLKSRGIPVVPVSKPKIDDRIKEMSFFINHNRFKVSQKFPELRHELQTYQYSNREKSNAVPIDRNNHALDAVGYALYSVRYLWRNDVSYASAASRAFPALDDDKDPFDDFNKPNTPKVGSSGLYSI